MNDWNTPKVDEINLLVWLTIHNMKDLGKVLALYTDTPESYYTVDELTRIVENAIVQFSECYQIKGLFREYFSMKRSYPDDTEYYILRNLFHYIRPDIFSPEELTILQDLKKNYVDKVPMPIVKLNKKY